MFLAPNAKLYPKICTDLPVSVSWAEISIPGITSIPIFIPIATAYANSSTVS